MGAAKYSKEVLTEAVANSHSFAGVLRYLGLRQAGGTHYHIARRIRTLEIDHSHFTGQGHNKGKTSPLRLSPEKILRILPENSRRLGANQLRRALEESGIEPVCNRCGLGREWQGKFLQLEVSHIDGNWQNCLLENLEFIYPNCHSQEPTNKPHKYRNLDSTPVPKKVRGGKVSKKSVTVNSCECGKVIASKSKQCVKCAHAKQHKIEWPPVHGLVLRLRDQKEPYISVAKSLGVTDTAVRKFLRTHGIDPKTFLPTERT